MFHFAVALRQPRTDFLGVVLERAIAALIGDAAALIDDVEPLRPGGVGVVRCIAHFINAEGDGEFEALGEIVGDGNALLKRLGLGVADIVLIFFVGIHPPLVGGVGFTDVDGQKIGVVFVIVIDLYDIADLATE